MMVKTDTRLEISHDRSFHKRGFAEGLNGMKTVCLDYALFREIFRPRLSFHAKKRFTLVRFGFSASGAGEMEEGGKAGGLSIGALFITRAFNFDTLFTAINTKMLCKHHENPSLEKLFIESSNFIRSLAW